MEKEVSEKNQVKHEEEIDNIEDNSTKDKEIIEDEKKELSPEEEVNNLKEKLARTLAEMENQRRRFEKEREDAFEYGGFSFAKESLNLLDNLERSKLSLENDEKLKNTETLKKVIEHLDIVSKDILSRVAKFVL